MLEEFRNRLGKAILGKEKVNKSALLELYIDMGGSLSDNNNGSSNGAAQNGEEVAAFGERPLNRVERNLALDKIRWYNNHPDVDVMKLYGRNKKGDKNTAGAVRFLQQAVEGVVMTKSMWALYHSILDAFERAEGDQN